MFSSNGVGAGTGHTTQEDSKILQWLQHGGKGEKGLFFFCSCISRPFFLIWFFCPCVLLTQLCPTLCNPMDCSPPGSSVHGMLEWVAAPFSKGSPRPRDQIHVSCIAGRFFTIWATKDAFINIAPQYLFLFQKNKKMPVRYQESRHKKDSVT